MHSFYGTRLSENMAETPEGYLICYDVKIARIGTQDYLGSELGVSDDVVKVNRPAEEVFKPATVASFEGKPFTNDHPYNLLDVNNTPIYEKGHVQNVRVSDDKTYLIADIMVKDSQTIQDIKNGKRELSAGYNCDCLQDEAGNWYQANIIGNHVALVDKGRAGEKVRINDAEWNEADHPRAKNGRFGKGNGGSSAPGTSKTKSSTKNTGKTNEVKSSDLKAKYGIYNTHEDSVRNRDTEKVANKYGYEYDSKAEGSFSKYDPYTETSYYLQEFKGDNGERVFCCSSYEDTPDGGGFKEQYIEAKSPEDAMRYMENEFIPSLDKTGSEGLKQEKSERGDTPEKASSYGDIPDRNDVNWRNINENARKSYESLGVELFNKGQTHPVLIHSWTAKTIDNGLDGAFISWVKEHAEETPERAEALGKLDKAFKNKDVEKASECWYELWKTIKKKYTTKEKPMKDSKSVLGKLLKAFAKDAEPEEMVEALEAVKGNDEEPDRLTKLETMVQDLCARMDAYDEATKKEEPEMTALDEVEKELEDEEPEEKKEVEDEDANNDPKLIEALEEKAQEDEDTTEEIKKEIADAKKVIAKIADKETRLAVADSLAKVIRGKIKSSDNYKKLMDASNKKPVVDSKAIDYKEVFKKIKDEKFRK